MSFFSAHRFLLKSANGQSLIEILIGISIITIIIGTSIYGIYFILSSTAVNQQRQTAIALAGDLMNKVRGVADANWLSIYNLPNKGVTSTYHVVASGTILMVATGTQLLTVDGVGYTGYFSVENVNRDASDNIVISGGTNDPSTQKITVTIEWSVGANVPRLQIVDYVTRWKNKAFNQGDWSGGSGQEGPLNEPNNRFASSTSNIDITSTPGVIKLRL